MFPETLSRVLVHVQAHLDEDVSLAALASMAGLSGFHFEREFKRLVGETVKQYTQRLRLERAAIRLVLHRDSVLDIALDCGYRNHETFTRAFSRRFGVPPKEYRRRGRLQAEPVQGPRSREVEHPGFELSALRVRRLEETHVAFIRHVGPYEEVDERLWSELTAWARRAGHSGGTVLLGIGHDAPGVTDPQRLRFDAAIRVPGPIRPRGRIGYQVLASGTFAVATHVGPYSTLTEAYQRIFPELMSLRGYRIIGLPCIEVYHTTVINPSSTLNHTDIYLPIQPLS